MNKKNDEKESQILWSIFLKTGSVPVYNAYRKMKREEEAAAELEKAATVPAASKI